MNQTGAMNQLERQYRREAQSVETVIAMALGVLTFLGLALLSLVVGRMLGADGPPSEPWVLALVAAAALVSMTVTVWWLLRARRNGL